ncbi:MAG: VWA domain-containing protein [Acidimicrobiales bacterium]
MGQAFIRGQKSKLDALTPSTNLRVGVGVTGVAVDVTCFGVDARGKLSDDRYMIFYNQTRSPEGAVVAVGPDAFDLALAQLPATIDRLVFTATVDGPGTMADAAASHLRLTGGGTEVARFDFSGRDFAREKAVIIAELYRKDGWRFAAVGQGFDGGLSALLKHFGGTEAEAAPAAAPTAPPPPPPPTANQKRVALEKRMAAEAPQLVSLAKKAAVSLEKKGLSDHRAKVALCLDISASMSGLYRSGKIQRFAEKVLALGTRFDDDGDIDVFLFGQNAHQAGAMDLGNHQGFVDRLLKQHALEGGTYYAKAMEMIRRYYFPDGGGGPRHQAVRSALPVYVMFLTDGEAGDRPKALEQVKWSSYEPLFWQFMGIGKSNKDTTLTKKRGFAAKLASLLETNFAFLEQLDTMEGRYVDNANFFSVPDPEAVPDEELYDLLMAEYPSWVKAAPGLGLLPPP